MRGLRTSARRSVVVAVVMTILAATVGISAASDELVARNNVFDAQVGVGFVGDVGDNDNEAGDDAEYAPTGGTIAPGLTLADDGSLTGVPTEAGSFLFSYQLSNGGTADTAFVRVDVAERVGSGEAVNARNNLFGGLAGIPFAVDVADNDATGDGTPVFELLHGALPPGVEFTNGGLLRGTPTEPGSYPFRYRLTDSDGDTDIAWVIVTIAAPTIADVATNDDRFSTLVTAVVAASDAGPIDFLTAISSPGDLTVFAPTNEAFAALGDTLGAALADPAGLLTDVLAYHVLGESETTDELLADGVATTLLGADVTITEESDGRIFVNDSEIIIEDIPTANGIVHVIDAVLLPPADGADDEVDEPAIADPTIAEVALGDERFSTLVTAVTLASEAGEIDFLAAISDPDADLTVFAPTNDAFTALGATLDAAIADPAGLLTTVLAYHVLGESETTDELLADGVATTLLGADVTITEESDGRIFVNDSEIIIEDIPTANGIVHVIDAVLIPA